MIIYAISFTNNAGDEITFQRLENEIHVSRDNSTELLTFDADENGLNKMLRHRDYFDEDEIDQIVKIFMALMNNGIQ